MADDPTGAATDLLAQLIRNACVNDGTPGSGQESRNVETLRSVVDGPGLDLEIYEPTPGRQSLVARIEGSDPSAPTLVLLGHTDVVPANPQGWSRDPFGGEIVDGFVWGRGAIDMLNLTSTMALAVRRLADRGFRPRGTLVLAAVADEEALGEHGAGWLTQHRWDAVGGEYAITESGGTPVPTPAGVRLGVTVGEKGAMWCKLRVRGTPGHASRPLRTDNALVTTAEVVRRLAAYIGPAIVSEPWRHYVGALGLPDDLTRDLTDPGRIMECVTTLEDVELARRAHACTHLTMAPTVVHGGTKTNVIPDMVDLEVDIRSLAGQSADDVRRELDHAIGDLRDRVEIIDFTDDPATMSPLATPLWQAIATAAAALAPHAACMPTITPGATDARFYRRRGTVAYGFGLFSGKLSLGQVSSMFHGDDERIDMDSLGLTTLAWELIATGLLERPA